MFVLSFDLLTFNQESRPADAQFTEKEKKKKKQRISQPCDDVTKCLREINLKEERLFFSVQFQRLHLLQGKSVPLLCALYLI